MPTFADAMSDPSTSTIEVTRARDGRLWNDYVAKHPESTADHLWEWREVIEDALGHESEYVVALRDGQVVGVLPLVLVRSAVFGRSVVSMPFLNYGGILADDADAAAALVDAARDAAIRFKASHVELRHTRRQCPELPCRRHKLSMTMALTPTADAFWTGLDRKVRNQVRKAQKESLELVSGGADLVDEFYTVFARNMRDLGTPVYPRRLFERTMRAFPDAARLFVVRHQGRTAAAGVTIKFRNVVLNPWASSLRELRQLNPNMLLYWSMIERAIADGAETFDFGRSSPESGTHHFKLQWGAVAQPQAWEYLLLSRTEAPDQGPTNPMFQRAIRVWQSLPLPIANVLGPFVSRGLP